MSEVKAKATRATNPKGYLINALRKKMNIKTTGQKSKAQEQTQEQEKKVWHKPKAQAQGTKSIATLIDGLRGM